MRLWILPILSPVACAFLLVAGIAALGQHAEQALRAESACTISFGDLVCDTPGTLTREEFLREVQYEADLPDELQRLDGRFTALLESAFARHPSVQKVERIEVNAGTVEVRLSFRDPVLHAGLPQSLPRSEELIPPASGRPGEEWEFPAIKSARCVANLLRFDKQPLPVVKMEFSEKDLVLWTAHESRIVSTGR